MKSRRVLQIFVAVLTIAVLACWLLLGALIVVGRHADLKLDIIVEMTRIFKNGLKAIAVAYSVPVKICAFAVFGAPALLLLLALILILTKNKGRDAKNVVGCVFALIGVLLITAFLGIFAAQLFDKSWVDIVRYACGGLLALFVLFVGLALGVGAKRKRVAASDEQPVDEAAQSSEATTVEEAEVAEENAPVEEKSEATDDSEKLALLEKIEESSTAEEVEERPEQETPVTKYVPQKDETIRDVVEKTYGKEGDSLTSTTIQKINKVRVLYEAKVITEEEYLKLMRKYLGF